MEYESKPSSLKLLDEGKEVTQETLRYIVEEKQETEEYAAANDDANDYRAISESLIWLQLK